MGVCPMEKRIFRSISVGIIVFAVAVLLGYLAYTITYQYQTKQAREQLRTEEVVSATSIHGDGTADVGETLMVEHYLARLEGDDIAIYMVMNQQAEFMYQLEVFTGNFPAEEILRLQNGIVLRNRQELMAFEEDYTS